MYKKKEIKRFYHVACIFELFKKIQTVKNIITNVEQIIGFDMIKTDEQVLISQLVAQIDQKIGHRTYQPIYALFIDLTIAFDHIDRNWLFQSIRQRVPPGSNIQLFQLMESVYD